jgi:hypothetical protein
VFERSIRITVLNDLLEISREKRGNRASLFILVHVPKLVGEEADGLMALADEYRVPKS